MLQQWKPILGLLLIRAEALCIGAVLGTYWKKILARYAESIRNIEDPRNMEEGIEDETGDAQLEHPRTGEPSGGKRPAIQRTCMQLEMLEPGPHGTSMHHPGKSS
jgi:hypothetical protein